MTVPTNTTATWVTLGPLPTAVMRQPWPIERLQNLRSCNPVTGQYEAGVSVYPGHIDGTTVYLDLVGINASWLPLDHSDIWEVIGGRRLTAADRNEETVFDYRDVVDVFHDEPVGAYGEPLMWVHKDDRDSAARKVNCTEVFVRRTPGGDWERAGAHPPTCHATRRAVNSSYTLREGNAR